MLTVCLYETQSLSTHANDNSQVRCKEKLYTPKLPVAAKKARATHPLGRYSSRLASHRSHMPPENFARKWQSSWLFAENLRLV
jgi:hypothetical protein